MKLHLAAGIQNLITGYGADHVLVNGERRALPLIVTPDGTEAGLPARFEDLSEAAFARIAALSPELVLLGTGGRQRFPHPRLYAALTTARIGVEAMDTGAACRTYNILVAEERRVVAVLFGDAG